MDDTFPFPIEPNPDNIARASDFAMRMWAERTVSRNRDRVAAGLPQEPLPTDLSGSCKFTSMFATRVFGGKGRGNEQHQYASVPGYGNLDLNADAADVMAMRTDADGSLSLDPCWHHRKFWGNREHREAMASCVPRVDAWMAAFAAELSEDPRLGQKAP